MRYLIILALVLFGLATSAGAQFSISIGLPGVSIGINVPVYPQLVRVPGYPVYYAPGLQSNFFFYDGMYWVYERDNWYASSWYNGPWGLVSPDAVPLYILRIPVRYYRSPPSYFRGWRADAPPRWGEHWGSGWEQQRSGWDRWNRRSVPAPAPLPTYQRPYSADRYPQPEQQQVLRSQNYRYQPRDAIVRQTFQQQVPQQQVPQQQVPQQQVPQQRAPQQHAPQQAPLQRATQQPPEQHAPQQEPQQARQHAPTQVQVEQQRAAPAQHPNPVPAAGRADRAPAAAPTAPAPRAPAVQQQQPRQAAPAVAPHEQRPHESARNAQAQQAPAAHEQPRQQARPAAAPRAEPPTAAKPEDGSQGRGQPQNKPDAKGKDRKEQDNNDRGKGG